MTTHVKAITRHYFKTFIPFPENETFLVVFLNFKYYVCTFHILTKYIIKRFEIKQLDIRREDRKKWKKSKVRKFFIRNTQI